MLKWLDAQYVKTMPSKNDLPDQLYVHKQKSTRSYYHFLKHFSTFFFQTVKFAFLLLKKQRTDLII